MSLFLPVEKWEVRSMKPLSPELLNAYTKALGPQAATPAERGQSQKWLRYYLDFCMKYRHPPRDPDSLEPFLQKLASKNQSVDYQEQAARCVSVYYEVVKNWDAVHAGPPSPRPVTAGAAARQPPAQAAAPAEAAAPARQPDAARLTWPACYRRLKEEIKLRQYSPKTLATYRIWTEQFQKYLNDKPPQTLDSEDAVRYLTYLATDCRVVASTQNQAFNALLFLYRHILKTDYDLRDKVVRARRTRYIPVCLTREEVDRVIALLEYPYNLIAGMLYGCGLRLFEGLNLRVGCVNFDEMIVTVHDGKGKKDRTIPLPERLKEELQQHVRRVFNLHKKDLKEGFAGVFMPGALDRKWRNAAKELVWQWVFPAKTLTLVPATGEKRRYHIHESVFQRVLREAVREAQIPKRVTAHTFRHSFASHLLQNNYDIRTIQEMLGHSDVRTTMIYTHTVKSRTQKERKSPLDF